LTQKKPRKVRLSGFLREALFVKVGGSNLCSGC